MSNKNDDWERQQSAKEARRIKKHPNPEDKWEEMLEIDKVLEQYDRH